MPSLPSPLVFLLDRAVWPTQYSSRMVGIGPSCIEFAFLTSLARCPCQHTDCDRLPGPELVSWERLLFLPESKWRCLLSVPQFLLSARSPLGAWSPAPPHSCFCSSPPLQVLFALGGPAPVPLPETSGYKLPPLSNLSAFCSSELLLQCLAWIAWKQSDSCPCAISCKVTSDLNAGLVFCLFQRA